MNGDGKRHSPCYLQAPKHIQDECNKMVDIIEGGECGICALGQHGWVWGGGGVGGQGKQAGRLTRESYGCTD
jgi:hypothetical protein